MIIVLLLFFKSICLFCQRLVLHIHDRWVNPKNVRLIKEAAEAKGVKFQIEDYRQSKKSKKRRYTGTSAYASPSTAPSPLLNSLGHRAESCRFCANTPQGYCRHHFHLQELQVHRQQQKLWCPLGGGFSNRSVEYKQLRKIKRELKRTLHQNQEQKTETSHRPSNTTSYHTVPTDEDAADAATYDESNSVNSTYNDSGYQTISLTNNSSNLEEEEQEEQQSQYSQVSQEYVDLPTPASVIETTYSFESCCETPRSSSPVPLPRLTSEHSFLSCESAAISTSYL